MNHFEYVLVLFISLFVPLLLSFSKPFGFAKNYPIALKTILISAIPYIIWDIIVTERGHWTFNKDYVLGLYFINLPLEEVLFFIVIPFCCLFTWNVLDKKWIKK